MYTGNHEKRQAPHQTEVIIVYQTAHIFHDHSASSVSGKNRFFLLRKKQSPDFIERGSLRL